LLGASLKCARSKNLGKRSDCPCHREWQSASVNAPPIPGVPLRAAFAFMKVPALQRLRAKMKSGTPVYGLWITLESPSICEMAVALGLDWVTIDAEHGHLDWK